ncbi:Hsp70/Hsp90 co-chaperone CNS1 [Wallemia ichthyophaga EXF-994]|uniref:Hsp70/Hsp90 co-chaperone CNS1 n=1 Tax=Wallemia ichthyophaga (strain EXF-994 / CBS 113033) TaxID=1299270 RepID=R9ARZ3_WALI9|nr:Hsp70/Hsp90 co-chaperone CNS1 [Wallemia ichthyophaga EXF-994]TIA75267.1 hypothetical protein E3P91_00535 [Wallemia ichthyophaga]EOR04963.1 Hsp70/Hsp90 co-chaperone CNS1 [Wallemia ichthyophaga EXF-994]TIA84057.1 hypothetical protein E3P98_00401 [Wallemia ichthyophaga]TIA97064.1 hypothetical protein E3P95_02991 [Wallemia ichthyophaga]TIA97722.1 hypothetical protein E3P94_03203 [Wallemia ichthyophaga]
MSKLEVDDAVAKLAEIGQTGVKPSLAEPRRAPTEKELNETPLFMKSLPENYQDNDTIQALQSLTFDGSPDEVALQFKEQANDYFKGKRFKEAIQFYTQSINANPSDKSLLESLYSNRAASNLELQNFGQTLKDTAQVLQINPRNTKALYRAARALNALERFDEATDAANHVLLLDSENKQAQVLLQHINTKHQSQLRRKIEISESQRRKHESVNALRDAIELSGVVIKGDIFKRDHPVKFDKNYLPESSKDSIPLFPPNIWSAPSPTTPIEFPANILYPVSPVGPMAEHIAGFSTLSTFNDQLHPMLNPPPPWDQTGEYSGQAAVSVYVATNQAKLLKVGMGLTLSKVLAAASKGKSAQQDGVPLNEGALNFIVLPKNDKEKKWVEDFKKQASNPSKPL